VEDDEEDEGEEHDEVEDQPAPPASRSRSPVNPKYTVINRARSSTAAPLDEESVEDEVVVKEVVQPIRLTKLI
jgi:hypothetical protein